MPDYKALIEKMKNGDRNSGYTLFSDTIQPVFYAVLKKTGNDERAGYIVRDAYILNMKHLDKLEHPSQFPLWTQMIALSTADSFIKRRGSAPLSNSFSGCTLGTDIKVSLTKAWDQDECGKLQIPEELALSIWSEVLKGLAGEALQPFPGLEDLKGGSDRSESGAYAKRRDTRAAHDVRAAGEGGADDAPENGADTFGAASDAEDCDNIKHTEALISKLQSRLAKAMKKRRRIAALLLCIFCAVFAAVHLLSRRSPSLHNISGIGELYQNPGSAKLLKIAGELSSQLAGELGEIYKSGDNYHLVIFLNTERGGGNMMSYESNIYSDSEYSIGNAAQRTEAETGKDGEAVSSENKDAPSPIKLDYHAIKRAKEQADKHNAYEQSGDEKITHASKPLVIKQELLNEIIAASESSDEAFNLMLTLKCRNVDLTKTVELTLDASVEKLLGDAGQLEIVLNDERHIVKLSKAQLSMLCDEYGSFTLKYQAENNRIYNIKFLNAEKEEIEELYGDMSFVLPSESSLTHIYASYSGGKSYAEGSENRGGHFDTVAKTISFPVSRSGRYELIGEETELFDLADLSKDMRTAAEFMSAMGFIKAESSGNFRPYRSIKRSELVDAIGQMFLHTDKTNTVGFSDVLPGDPSYDFLAAGVESSIIQGYGDDTFGGELPATRQELLTMCANTLVAGNICSYPEAPESFIKFSDRDRIAGYAVNAVALAVQQRLIESGGRLEPEAEASRGFAALVLYRMYTQYFR